jgi:hypothetical protein
MSRSGASTFVLTALTMMSCCMPMSSLAQTTAVFTTLPQTSAPASSTTVMPTTIAYTDACNMLATARGGYCKVTQNDAETVCTFAFTCFETYSASAKKCADLQALSACLASALEGEVSL